MSFKVFFPIAIFLWVSWLKVPKLVSVWGAEPGALVPINKLGSVVPPKFVPPNLTSVKESKSPPAFNPAPDVI